MLNKRIVILLAVGLCCAAQKTLGQTKAILPELYIASTIPDSLKKDANAVVRYSMRNIVVKSPGHATIKDHSIITILNEKANDEAEIEVGYNKKFNSVGTVEMVVYDADGKQIKKYRKGDMYDRAENDGMSIITDDRMMGMRHTIASYPVTIEQTTELEVNSCLNFSSWHITRPEIAVQNASCRVLANPAVGFRYLTKNTVITPQKSTQGNMEMYLWEVKNITAIKPEEGSADWRVFPKIYFTANQFEYDGRSGSFSTWQDYGIWQLALNSDVCSLTPAREEEIRQMTADIKTDKEKVKFLYQYLQHNMRYVSVQLGIGGLKPFAATFVDQKKYGDCKALANYMTALLKAVNIPSYFSIVRAGANEQPADADFPNDTFNHIIVCVPLKGDTTWLECTDMRRPFGKLSTFTENRNALLITETGGKLVNTPKSTIEDNQFKSEVNLTLLADGGAKAKLKIFGTGGYRDQYLSLSDQKTDDQKKILISYLGMKQPATLDIMPVKDKEGTIEMLAEMDFDRFCDVAAGSTLFYHPAMFDIWRLTLPPLEKRKSDYYFEHPMQKTCVTTFELPLGYEVESMPANTSLKFTYGNFSINYVYDTAKNQVITSASFILNNFVIPAAKYNEMQQYMDDIARAQNKKLVIRKKA
jgi:hypothetical protein